MTTEVPDPCPSDIEESTGKYIFFQFISYGGQQGSMKISCNIKCNKTYDVQDRNTPSNNMKSDLQVVVKEITTCEVHSN